MQTRIRALLRVGLTWGSPDASVGVSCWRCVGNFSKFANACLAPLERRLGAAGWELHQGWPRRRRKSNHIIVNLKCCHPTRGGFVDHRLRCYEQGGARRDAYVVICESLRFPAVPSRRPIILPGLVLFYVVGLRKDDSHRPPDLLPACSSIPWMFSLRRLFVGKLHALPHAPGRGLAKHGLAKPHVVAELGVVPV